MRKTNLLPFILGSVGMLTMILDGKTAVSGVSSGVQLCIQTLIPSLFPFFFLTALVTGSLIGTSIAPLRWVCRLCRMPAGSESLLLVGILGGYPVGAGNIAAELSRGRIKPADAQRLCVFCNNAGPSFLFGILGPLFPHLGWVWGLWGIQIAAAVLTAVLLPGGCTDSLSVTDSKSVSLPDALNRSIKSMAIVCGWVILFRLILTFLSRWLFWLLPDSFQILLTGILELSNGCLSLSAIEYTEIRFIFAGIMLSLGGVCVWMQTQAVFPKLRLSYYIAGRFLHCLICLILSSPVILSVSGPVTGICCTILIFSGFMAISLSMFLRKQKKEVAFCDGLMYNSL